MFLRYFLVFLTLASILQTCYTEDQLEGAATFHENPVNPSTNRIGGTLPQLQKRAPVINITSFSKLKAILNSETNEEPRKQPAETLATFEALEPEFVKVKRPPVYKVPVLVVGTLTTLMSLLSGFGALPFLFMDRLNAYWSGIANAIGCGVMLAASFELFEESKSFGPGLVVLGVLLGVAGMKISQAFLDRYEDVSFADLQGADARKVLLIFGVMSVHAFGEGSGVGVSFSGPRGWAKGLLVTVAIGLHNIPEGMAMASVLIAKGTSPFRAVTLTLLSALPQALVAVPSFLFVETFASLLPIAMGFAAGCMIWIVFAELVPDALEEAPHSDVATAATLSAVWLQAMGMFMAQLENPDGTMSSPFALGAAGHSLRTASWLVPGITLLFALAAAASSRLLTSLPSALGSTVGVLSWLALSTFLRHFLVLRDLGLAGGGSGSVLLALLAAAALGVSVTRWVAHAGGCLECVAGDNVAFGGKGSSCYGGLPVSAAEGIDVFEEAGVETGLPNGGYSTSSAYSSSKQRPSLVSGLSRDVFVNGKRGNATPPSPVVSFFTGLLGGGKRAGCGALRHPRVDLRKSAVLGLACLMCTLVPYGIRLANVLTCQQSLEKREASTSGPEERSGPLSLLRHSVSPAVSCFLIGAACRGLDRALFGSSPHIRRQVLTSCLTGLCLAVVVLGTLVQLPPGDAASCAWFGYRLAQAPLAAFLSTTTTTGRLLVESDGAPSAVNFGGGAVALLASQRSSITAAGLAGGFCAGALLAACWCCLWPAATVTKARQARAGLLLGGCLAVVLGGLGGIVS